MKTALLALCVLCATAAFGQASSLGYSALNSQPVVIQMPSNPLHASQTPIAQEQTLLETSGSVSAKGERPLSEFASVNNTPLGDSARALRKEHEKVKKAEFVYEN